MLNSIKKKIKGAEFIINKCHNLRPTVAMFVFELFHAMNMGVDNKGDTQPE